MLYAGINLVSGGAMKIFDAIRTCSLHGVRPYNFEAAIFGDGLKACEWVDLHVAANLIFCGVAGAAGSDAAPPGSAPSPPRAGSRGSPGYRT
ncbi:MAG TPA: hypothetical protein VFC03_01775 [Acidimicrobiales bacterium]|nr:hypothetical protein [Acidimicrobiales bacterium]